MKFLDIYNIYTTAPKRRIKTMLIRLPKIAQNSSESPQKLSNLSQKYNHIQIHIFSSILTFKSLIYSSNPNWYEILNRKHQTLTKNTPENSQICIVQHNGKLCMSMHMEWLQNLIFSLPRNLKTPIIGSPSP